MCNCIFDYVCKEYRENGGINLHEDYLRIHKNWRHGFITTIQAMNCCEQVFDRIHNIYK